MFSLIVHVFHGLFIVSSVDQRGLSCLCFVIRGLFSFKMWDETFSASLDFCYHNIMIYAVQISAFVTSRLNNYTRFRSFKSNKSTGRTQSNAEKTHSVILQTVCVQLIFLTDEHGRLFDATSGQERLTTSEWSEKPSPSNHSNYCFWPTSHLVTRNEIQENPQERSKGSNCGKKRNTYTS